MITIKSSRAGNTFEDLLDTVQKGESVKVTRNQKEVAIVLSIEDYELLGVERLRLLKRSERLTHKNELQRGIDDLNSGRSQEASPDFWCKIKESIKI